MGIKITDSAVEVTYFDRRARVKTIFEAGLHGIREVRMLWLDDADPRSGGWKAGTVTSRTVTGNARRGTFKVLTDIHIVDEF